MLLTIKYKVVEDPNKVIGSSFSRPDRIYKVYYVLGFLPIFTIEQKQWN